MTYGSEKAAVGTVNGESESSWRESGQRGKSSALRPVALLAAIVLLGFLMTLPCLAPCAHAAAAGKASVELESGIYSIDGVVLNESLDEASMANGAFKSYELWVDKGETILKATLVPVKDKEIVAYLGNVYYYPNYAGASKPESEKAKEAEIESSYNLVDEYGEDYPKVVSFPIDMSLEVQWLRLSIPFMESQSPGVGTKYVRLKLDYSSMEWERDIPEEDSSSSSDSESGSSSSSAAEASQVAPDSYYQQLAEAIAGADEYLLKTGVYTSESLAQLREKRNAAQKTYDKHAADALTVVMQISDIRWGILMLQRIEVETEDALDFADLEDGTYTVVGSMVKTDKATLSMADSAIDHNVTVIVEDGAYTLQLALKGITVNGKLGYLGAMRYYKDGYSVNSAGAVEGETAKATVLSYQTSGKKRVSDDYGTDYPAEISFPLVAQAKKSGYVPLSLTVPIMEAIAKGTGTQTAYLKLETDEVYGGKQDVAPDDDSSSAAAEESSSGADSQDEGAGTSIADGTDLGTSSLGSGSDAGSLPAPAAASAPAATSTPATPAPAASSAASASASEKPAAKAAVPEKVGEADEGDFTADAKVYEVTPVEKKAPLQGSGSVILVAVVAVAVMVLGGAAFRKRDRFEL